VRSEFVLNQTVRRFTWNWPQELKGAIFVENPRSRCENIKPALIHAPARQFPRGDLFLTLAKRAPIGRGRFDPIDFARQR
jgi:hypothetical protein